MRTCWYPYQDYTLKIYYICIYYLIKSMGLYRLLFALFLTNPNIVRL